MKKNALRFKWSKKEGDYLIYYPDKRDGGMLHTFFSRVTFDNKTFLQELEERGYAMRTIKFSIELKEK